MVDFSLTQKDKELIALQLKENEIGRKMAREIDRTYENGPAKLFGVHPEVEGKKSPDELLAHDPSGTSGPYITEALLALASAQDHNLRDTGDEAFGTWMVRDYGTEEQKKKYGHLKLAIGITEPSAGSDPSVMRTNAKFDPATNEYVLNGEKVFISSINKYDGALTLMKGEPDANGKATFLTVIVTKDLPGFTEIAQFKKLGLHGFDIGGFILDNVRVPADRRVDAGFAKTMGKFNHNRPMVSAVAMAKCRSLLDFTYEKMAEAGVTVDYAKGRAARSAVEEKLVQYEAMWEAVWGTVMRAKWLEEVHGEESDAFRVEASIAKALGGKCARLITQGCLEVLGPEGLSEDYLAEKWFRDVRIADIYEGAGEIQRILIARPLLGYKKELN
ncbi:MAG: acyl-CoA dehydrogenase family protein [Hyphomonadaceae bacterium]